MRATSSFQGESEFGTLYIVPTPIGNLNDITIRALEILKEADAIAAEDTRNTGRLLHHFEISKPMISYHEHNKRERQSTLINDLKEGKLIALVSDAGMPGISDPGSDLVKAAIDEEITVVVLPGANAALAGLVGSGLPTENFYFHGFLARKNKEKKAAIEKLKLMTCTIIFYESPHRLVETLEFLHEHLGNRNVSIARELTKRYEEYIRGELAEVVEWARERTLKGEFCIVVEGLDEETLEQEAWWQNTSLKKHVEKIIDEEGLSSKEAIKEVATIRGLKKREVYQAYHLNEE
ncbi:16S rRNA (cytidine(1402)-2'-O)-methyltransferase [Saliterribacillus persicus]|uniref:Ribosomal RNA small subunit methyltransferase I n=1 Tax=Saliterribacillus persicus TaxID=930114 RepID=A0A368X794_9BACI|nr:16S rRNA (cytidine(1402)-2'-O)-methyltransferase [Saliterribacillus persicus]RCW63066.1 16S rRNA (cytidine1402-2'-O)-methyltransferase [Saliterribacillus persicus]